MFATLRETLLQIFTHQAWRIPVRQSIVKHSPVIFLAQNPSSMLVTRDWAKEADRESTAW